MKDLGTYGLESAVVSVSWGSWKDGRAVTELESEELFLNPPLLPVVVVWLLSDGEEARVDPDSLRDRGRGRSLSLSRSMLAIERGVVGAE